MFHSSHFSFLVFGHFWRLNYENANILRNLCLHFARQDGQDGKKTERKSRNCNDQNTKNQKTKIWDEQNKCPDTTYISHIHLRASSKQRKRKKNKS
jgi:hypothetical protein